MSCTNQIVGLPCGMTGTAYTSSPMHTNGNSIVLQGGHGVNLPDITAGGFYFVNVADCNGCCGSLKVTAKVGDTLTVVPKTCGCIASNARVTYDNTSIEYIRAVALGSINFAAPLHYDCDTNTVSINCDELAQMDCGCGKTV